MTPHPPATILIVDDEPNTRVVLRKLLASHSYQVDAAKDAQEALAWLDQHACDVMLIDYKMPGMNGIELAHAVRQRQPDIKTIIVTAHGTISMAVQAMKEGVHDYLTKPVNPDELLLTIERALEHKRLASQVAELRKELGERYEFHNIIGKSKPMQQVFDIIEKASQTDVTVLIQGDTGTGKELVARAIHFNSARRAKPLVAVSCVAFQENILESELFGHVEGAFTGAIRDKVGRFEMADGGSLFLDDVNLIPPNIQAKLLRVLEERKFERVGGTKQIQVDIRLISSTNVSLEDEVRKGAFRSDLYHRINVLTINLPPLRDRKEDIPLLTQHFLKKTC
ncbi:MAG: sigma-54-dependent Fis family transcriptional regulator, partial [Planctomycetes bacterium]|nr:sigma-54-dependent Fis family transcriptional regulator [Planctomycetota bacterium]